MAVKGLRNHGRLHSSAFCTKALPVLCDRISPTFTRAERGPTRFRMIKIDPEFQNAIPPLSEAELAALTESLKSEGCREALVVWDGILVDGHNRFAICIHHEIPFETRNISFPSRTSALVWMKKNQLGRRNLTDYQRAEIALSLKEDLAKLARERQGRRTDLEDAHNIPANLPGSSGETRDALADMAGVSGRTLDKVERITLDAIPEVREKAKTGELSIHAAAQIAEMPEDEQEEIITDIEAGAKPTEAIKKAHVAHNSGNNEWYTPAHFVEAARSVMGTIDLDPASSEIANQTVKATQFFTSEDSGLEKVWRGRVFLNPPYAQPLIAQFIEKAVEQFCQDHVPEAIVLVNNGTDTAWGQALLGSAAAVCFPKSRIRFIDPMGKPSGAPLQGQMIAYLGRNRDRFFQEFGKFGVCFANR